MACIVQVLACLREVFVESIDNNLRQSREGSSRSPGARFMIKKNSVREFWKYVSFSAQYILVLTGDHELGFLPKTQ